MDAIEALVGSANVTYAPGYESKLSEPDDALIASACDVARAAEAVVLCVGLPAIYESEGFDRDHLRLPEQHDRLIEAVCAANPHTAVVLTNGAPVVMPWLDAPSAILEGYLAGPSGWRRVGRFAVRPGVTLRQAGGDIPVAAGRRAGGCLVSRHRATGAVP